MRTLLKNALLVPMTASLDVTPGSLLLNNGLIEAVLAEGASHEKPDRTLDLEGHALLPGFIQSHIHCCQSLFRGMADDLHLLEWLNHRIWPLEAAHQPASIATSTRLAALELLLGGTTSFLSMETVNHTDHIFDALKPLPIRGVIGKCLMDQGDEVPAELIETGEKALKEALDLVRRFPATPGARLRACLAPRFAISCSEGLLRDVAAVSRENEILVHTHGAEQVDEVQAVVRQTGHRNFAYFDHLGLASDRLRVAHAVHLDEAEEGLLRDSGTHVLHCPSSNLKLGSGIAPIARYLEEGIPVSIGADGAPCSNNLDALREVRLSALLQKVLAGPTALPAPTALQLITIDAARALGLENEVGTIEPGKRADLVEMDLGQPHIVPGGDTYSRIVYAADRGDIRRVFFDGEIVVENGRATYCDQESVVSESEIAAGALFSRAGLSR